MLFAFYFRVSAGKAGYLGGKQPTKSQCSTQLQVSQTAKPAALGLDFTHDKAFKALNLDQSLPQRKQHDCKPVRQHTHMMLRVRATLSLAMLLLAEVCKTSHKQQRKLHICHLLYRFSMQLNLYNRWQNVHPQT